MNLNLTQDQAQAVIDSQAEQIKALKLRLAKAHVTMKYLTRAELPVTPAELRSVIAHLEEAMDADNVQAAETGYSDLNHGAMQERVEQFQKLLDQAGSRSVKLPMLGYHHVYLRSFSDGEANNVESYVASLMTKHLWREGEPETPNFFSSHGMVP